MRLNAILLGAHLQQPQQFQDPFRPLVGIDIIQAFDPLPVFSHNLPGNGIGIFMGHGHIPFLGYG
jgi:hypothetical protein